jgi:iron(III) transport system permease protein
VASATIETRWTEVAALIWRPRVGELLINTALLTIIATPLCVVLGVGLAVLSERTDLPGHRLWSMTAAAPLAIPAFVHSYAWVSVAPSLHGLFAGVLVSVLAYFTFLYLPVAASLRGLDPALEDVAASLGLTPCRVFFRVVLPLGVPLITLMRWIAIGGARVWKTDEFASACLQPPGIWVDCRLRKPFVGVPATPDFD